MLHDRRTPATDRARTRWAKPAVTRMRAGSAEVPVSKAGVGADGGSFS
jgi:hypothetical protein